MWIFLEKQISQQKQYIVSDKRHIQIFRSNFQLMHKKKQNKQKLKPYLEHWDLYPLSKPQTNENAAKSIYK